MSQILICDVCGAKIEIEDSDERLSVAESKIRGDENVSEVILCENCENLKFDSLD